MSSEFLVKQTLIKIIENAKFGCGVIHNSG